MDENVYRRILSIPAYQDPQSAALLTDIRNADLVLHGTKVIKDRYGPEAGEATPEQLALARGDGLTINLSTGDKLLAMILYMESAGGGAFGVNVKNGQWSTAAEFGSEAEDSPMAGGAAYGSGETLDECLDQMLKDTRADIKLHQRRAEETPQASE